MESDSGFVDLRLLWEFMAPTANCGHADLDSWLWGCAWLHVFIDKEAKDELEELFEYYGDRGRLPFKRFRRLLCAWGDERQNILLRRCVMGCSRHT